MAAPFEHISSTQVAASRIVRVAIDIPNTVVLGTYLHSVLVLILAGRYISCHGK